MEMQISGLRNEALERKILTKRQLSILAKQDCFSPKQFSGWGNESTRQMTLRNLDADKIHTYHHS